MYRTGPILAVLVGLGVFAITADPLAIPLGHKLFPAAKTAPELPVLPLELGLVFSLLSYRDPLLYQLRVGLAWIGSGEPYSVGSLADLVTRELHSDGNLS
jgi:hypothetical protein